MAIVTYCIFVPLLHMRCAILGVSQLRYIMTKQRGRDIAIPTGDAMCGIRYCVLEPRVWLRVERVRQILVSTPQVVKIRVYPVPTGDLACVPYEVVW